MSMRFHMLSIAGIFIGLGLGILVGASMTGDHSLLAQQQAMIDRLDADFVSLSAERSALTAELDMFRQYADESVAHIVGSALFGQRVAVFAVGSAASSVASLVRACETARGSVGVVVKFDVATAERLGAEDWADLAQALADGDTGRIRSLAADVAGASSVALLTPGGCSSVMVMAVAAEGGQAAARAVRGLVAGGTAAKAPETVLGWVGAAPASGRHDGMQGLTCTQVAGVGAAPGNTAAVLALAGARGDYGRAPATSFLPPPGTWSGSAVGGLR